MSQGMPKKAFGEQFKFVVEGDATSTLKILLNSEGLRLNERQLLEMKNKAELQANLNVLVLLLLVRNHLDAHQWMPLMEWEQRKRADIFRQLTAILDAYPAFANTLDLYQLKHLILKHEGFYKFTAEFIARIGMPRILEFCSDPVPKVRSLILTAVQVTIAQTPTLI
jgi:hypothetical protein